MCGSLAAFWRCRSLSLTRQLFKRWKEASSTKRSRCCIFTRVPDPARDVSDVWTEHKTKPLNDHRAAERQSNYHAVFLTTLRPWRSLLSLSPLSAAADGGGSSSPGVRRGGLRRSTSDTSLGVFDKLTLADTECRTQLVKYTKWGACSPAAALWGWGGHTEESKICTNTTEKWRGGTAGLPAGVSGGLRGGRRAVASAAAVRAAAARQPSLSGTVMTLRSTRVRLTIEPRHRKREVKTGKIRARLARRKRVEISVNTSRLWNAARSSSRLVIAPPAFSDISPP